MKKWNLFVLFLICIGMFGVTSCKKKTPIADEGQAVEVEIEEVEITPENLESELDKLETQIEQDEQTLE